MTLILLPEKILICLIAFQVLSFFVSISVSNCVNLIDQVNKCLLKKKHATNMYQKYWCRLTLTNNIVYRDLKKAWFFMYIIFIKCASVKANNIPISSLPLTAQHDLQNQGFAILM